MDKSEGHTIIHPVSTPKHRRFWLKFSLFILPFALGFILVSAFTLYTGEALPLTLVAQAQQDGVTLYRPRYGNRDQQYKALMINERQPDVLAIGSSRILQFRADFFNRDPSAFYNAAAPAWRLEQIRAVLETVDSEALPEVLILAIDPPWFNAAYEGDTFPAPQSDASALIGANIALLSDVLRGVPLDRPNFEMMDYLEREIAGTNSPALGLRAIRDGHGFRDDGSELYGDFLIAGWLYAPNARDAHMAWMRDGQEMYVYGSSLNPVALAALDDLLAWASARDIIVIGFLPSYMPSLWNEMMTRGNHTYLEQLNPALETMFADYDFPFFDFSNGAWIGTPDEAFFDGWHASELGNLRLYLQMVDALPDLLGVYTDAAALRTVAASAENTWDVFGL